MDENREIVLYSNRPCLHTLISLPLANSYPSLPSPYLNQPKANSHLLPGTMPHLMELSLSSLYLEPVSHLDTIYYLSYLLNTGATLITHLHIIIILLTLPLKKTLQPPPPQHPYFSHVYSSSKNSSEHTIQLLKCSWTNKPLVQFYPVPVRSTSKLF